MTREYILWQLPLAIGKSILHYHDLAAGHICHWLTTDAEVMAEFEELRKG
jgi:hypothetical protein